MENKGIKLGVYDNVATLTEKIQPNHVCTVAFQGEQVQITAVNAIPFGHKIAIKPIAKGEKIIKYNEVIGLASQDIQPGEHVHVHNVQSIRGRGDIA